MSGLKKICKCRVAIFLVVGWVVLSLIGYLGKDTIYKNYTIDPVKTPYFVLVFDGIHDGIYPWSGEQEDFWEKWSPSGENIGTAEETEAVADTETETATETVSDTEMALDTETATEELPKEKEFVTVDESYFDDAVFIGDSRTVGLYDYSGLDKATFYATVGLNVYDMWDEAFCNVDGKMVTLEEALRVRQFKKVYFQIGINEMGRGTVDTFMEAYRQSVAKFQELQPDAIIYVQAIMKVTTEKSNNDDIFNNVGIQERNDRIAQLADNQTIFFIDVNEVVCDETGGLDPELTFDNLHLYGSKYDIWVDFLKSKGIE